MNYTIILRHAERHHITNFENTEIASLTLKGKINSILMGNFLRKKFENITLIKTSYIER